VTVKYGTTIDKLGYLISSNLPQQPWPIETSKPAKAKPQGWLTLKHFIISWII
jgi:hypothetical protein